MPGTRRPGGTPSPFLEVDLTVLVQLLPVDRDAGVQNRVQLVAIGPGKVPVHQLVHLCRAVDLVAVEVRLEVMQPVWVGLLSQDGGAVVVGEGRLDGVGVV